MYSTWNELNSTEVAFLPIGSIEQHGLHLPLGTDGIIAKAIANRLSERFTPSYLLPMLPFSSSYEHASFSGSISLTIPTIYGFIRDVLHSLQRSGISRLVLVNGHGGNHLLRNIAQEINVEKPHILLVPSHKHWENAYQKAKIKTSTSQDMHAGEGETSLLLHLQPQMVRQNELKDIDTPQRPLLETVGMKAYTATGTIGFPSRANAEKGELLLEEIVNQISDIVEEFLHVDK
jgi:creatinine amidohydrolase